MIIPPFLSPGDALGLLAPSRKVTPEQMAPHRASVEQWGFAVHESPLLFEADHQFGGTDAIRAEAAAAMMTDPNLKALLAVRGGYGAVRILDLLPWEALLENPKWLVGFSDFTALHAHANSRGLATLHAAMPMTFPTTSGEAVAEIGTVLGGQWPSYTFAPTHPNRPGRMEGTLVGGNLSVLYSLVGSSSLRFPTGCILFLEDLDEYLYHLDRMMMGLLRAGVLQGVSALVVGGMTDMHDNEVPFGETAEAILRRFAHQLKIPIAFGFPAGHMAENRPVLLGAPVRLEVFDDHSTLSYLP